MSEISNKTIVGLLVLALVITVGSTAISVSKLQQLGGIYNFITGAPSFSFGETNITVQSVTSLSLVGANGTVLSFGSGYVNGSCNFCQMDSNSVFVSGYTNGSNLSGTQQTQCCVSFIQPSAGFLLENDGNTNLSVGYTCSGNCTFDTFIGGTRGRYVGGIGGSGLEIKVTSNNIASQGGEAGGLDTAASCRGGGILYRDSGWNITNSSAYSVCPTAATNAFNGNCTGFPSATYAAMVSTGHYLCGNTSNFPLMPDNTQDAAVIDINITIIADSGIGGGRSSFRLTFNGTSSG